MGDNYETDVGSGGKTYRSLQDAASLDWPACVVCYATTVGTPDVLVEVTPANQLPVMVYANTVKDASGTDYVPLVDDDGHFQIDTLSVVPGTGATNLGKAIDSVVGGTDTGVALLGKHSGDNVHITTADGDYEILRVSDYGALQVAPEQHHTFDGMNATSGWAALGNDTLNLATTKKHVLGTDALSFDKVDGDANTVFAGIEKTISSVDLGDISPHDILQLNCYLSSIATADYVFLRVGTNSSNYNEWRVDAEELTGGIFETLALSVGDANYTGITGNGWVPTAITYLAVGVAFDAETDTLSGIVFDEISFHTNQHTSSTLNAEVSSSVSTPNINLHKVRNKSINVGAGTVGTTGTMRMTLGSDDPAVASLATLDNVVAVLGTATYSEATTSGNVIGAVRNDDLATLADTDNEIAPIQVNSAGALYTENSPQVDYVFDGSSKCTIKRATGLAATGTTAMVAAVATKKIRVLAIALFATSATVTNVYIANDNNNIIGDASNPIPLATDADGDNVAGFALAWNPGGWFEMDTVNEALNLVLSAAQDVIYALTYIEVA